MTQVIFRPGPPMFVVGLGNLPGPIDRIIEDGVIYLVDDRRAGEEHVGERSRLVCITQQEAVAKVSSGPPPAQRPPAVIEPPPEVEPPVEGAAAAARILGLSDRTIRSWLARCPPAHWPQGSKPGDKAVWLTEVELRQWWSTRYKWGRRGSGAQDASPGKQPQRGKAAARVPPAAAGARERIMAAARGKPKGKD